MVVKVGIDGTASPTDVRAPSAAPSAALQRAAALCAQRLRFVPARGSDGSVVAASSIVSLTISKRQPSRLPRTRREGTI
jgi:hypothetical protein